MAELTQKRERIISMDIVRAICPLMIVIYHFSVAADASGLSYIQPLMNSVRFETTLFFMISGASLTLSQGDRKFSLKKYAKKRFLAIFPLFYFCWLVAYSAICVVNHKIVLHTPWTFPLTLIGFDGYFSGTLDTWYVSVGEWFLGPLVFCYVIFPLLHLIVRKQKGIVVGLLLVAEIIMTVFQVASLNSIIISLVSFSIGMELQNIHEWMEEKPWIAAITFPLLVIFLVLFQQIPKYYISAQIISVLIFVTLACVEKYIKKGLQKVALLAKIIRFLSGISYPFYLIQHVVVIFITATVPSILGNGLDVLILIIILCIGGAQVLNMGYQFVVAKVRLLFQRKALRTERD